MLWQVRLWGLAPLIRDTSRQGGGGGRKRPGLHEVLKSCRLSLDHKCSVFYAAPTKSKLLSTLCSADVCQCAEGEERPGEGHGDWLGGRAGLT